MTTPPNEDGQWHDTDRRKWDPVQCAVESGRMDRMEDQVRAIREEYRGLEAQLTNTNTLLTRIETQLEVLKVKSGLIGTIAALIVGGGMVLFDWLKTKTGGL